MMVVVIMRKGGRLCALLFFMFVNCSQVACKLSVSCFDGVELLCECWVVFEPIIEVFWFNVCVFCSFRYVVGLFVEL